MCRYPLALACPGSQWGISLNKALKRPTLIGARLGNLNACMSHSPYIQACSMKHLLLLAFLLDPRLSNIHSFITRFPISQILQCQSILLCAYVLDSLTWWSCFAAISSNPMACNLNCHESSSILLCKIMVHSSQYFSALLNTPSGYLKMS